MKTKLLLLQMAIALVVSWQALGQNTPPQKVITQRFQQWVGYMTSTRVSDKFSWWNDFHYVPDGFYVARTGLTYHFPQSVNITAGYAYLGLPSGGVTADLKRSEHRPWGQMVISTPIAPHWSHMARVRYDARFRHNISGGELIDGYTFNHRLRFLTNIRKQFPALKPAENWMPFVSVSDEVLINFGKNIIYNYLDQNRATATIGMQHQNISFQVGYMNRFVQLSEGNKAIANHTLILWVVHTLDRRRVASQNP